MNCYFCNAELITAAMFSRNSITRYYCNKCHFDAFKRSNFVIEYDSELDIICVTSLIYKLKDTHICIFSDLKQDITRIIVNDEYIIEAGSFTNDFLVLENKVNRVAKLFAFL